MNLTKEQLDIIDHAIGKTGFRNHFVTGEGTADFPICEELVNIGVMHKQVRNWVDGYIYTVNNPSQWVKNIK